MSFKLALIFTCLSGLGVPLGETFNLGPIVPRQLVLKASRMRTQSPKRYKLGAIATPVKVVRSAWKLRRSRRILRAIPESLDLREGISYLPEIGSQSKQDCVAWATAYYAYSYAVGQQGKLGDSDRGTPKFVFSPQYLYTHINRGVDAGATVGDAMGWLENHGCATLLEAPYDPADFSHKPTDEAENRAGQYIARRTICFASIGDSTPFDADTLREYMATTHMPVVAAMMIYQDFPGGNQHRSPKVSTDFVYDHPMGKKADIKWGNHAMAIVGYDTSKHAFLVANSWGKDWGAGGYLWISDAYLQGAIVEIWGFVPGGPVARGSPRRGAKEMPIVISNDLEAVPPTTGQL